MLRATGYLTSGSKRVMKRLIDTGHMICECVVDGSLRPETRGEGWKVLILLVQKYKDDALRVQQYNY